MTKKAYLIIGREPASVCPYTTSLTPAMRWLTESESHGLAKVLIAGSDPATDFAKEFSVFHEGLVLAGITDLKAEIIQIAEMLVVARVR